MIYLNVICQNNGYNFMVSLCLYNKYDKQKTQQFHEHTFIFNQNQLIFFEHLANIKKIQMKNFTFD